MRKSIVLFALLFSFAGKTQNVRLNFSAGLANYYGELQGKKIAFSQAKPVLGIGATLDLSSKLLLRGEFSMTQLEADDKKSYHYTRNLNFKTNIWEGDLLLEYNLRNLSDYKLTPYVFAGVGVFNFDPYTFDSVKRKVYLRGLSTEGQGFPEFPDRKVAKRTQINIPIGGGLKYAISEDVYFGFEYGLRILFTDHLDDVSTKYVDQNLLLDRRGPLAVELAFRGDELKNDPKPYPADGTLRGSSRINDLYYYGLARLSIRMNWFENGTGFGGRKSRYGCPSRVL